MTESTDLLVAGLRAPLAAGPPLRLAVLFGSGARGALREASDLDVAIWPASEDLPLGDEAQLAAALATAMGRPVDLVRLDRASTFVRWQVARDGVPLVASNPVEWPRFVARAASDWGDFRPAMEEAARRFQRRLAEGAGR